MDNRGWLHFKAYWQPVFVRVLAQYFIHQPRPKNFKNTQTRRKRPIHRWKTRSPRGYVKKINIFHFLPCEKNELITTESISKFCAPPECVIILSKRMKLTGSFSHIRLRHKQMGLYIDNDAKWHIICECRRQCEHTRHTHTTHARTRPSKCVSFVRAGAM